jgi:hypothetical protein
MVTKARAWASYNKSTPYKANSRQKKYYENILDHFSTELGRRGGHELLTLLASHASKIAWMAAQELNQLINPVSERSTSAVATARFPDFVQQHWI